MSVWVSRDQVTIGNDGSGDIFLGFSTAALVNSDDGTAIIASSLTNEHLDPLFEAVVQATDEAVVDSMIANETMTGCNGITAHAINHLALRDLLQSRVS